MQSNLVRPFVLEFERSNVSSYRGSPRGKSCKLAELPGRTEADFAIEVLFEPILKMFREGLRGRQLQDFAIEVFLEEREEVFRKGLRGRRSIVGVFEDVVEEFVGKGGEVIDSRGRLRRRKVNKLVESMGRLVQRTLCDSEGAEAILS